jgi:hypothetical protein
MACKYIIVGTPKGERAVIFADDFFHDQFARACDEHDVIAAGFVTLDPDGDIACFGRSEGLDIGSRGLDDEMVIRHQIRKRR